MKGKFVFVAVAVTLLLGCGKVPPKDAAEPKDSGVNTEPKSAGSIFSSADSYAQCIEDSGPGNMAMHECASEVLDQQDKRMNAAYKRAMTEFDDNGRLGDRQRAWIKYRDAECAVDEERNGPQAGLTSLVCLFSETERRAETLEALLPAGSPAESNVDTGPIHADWLEEVTPEEGDSAPPAPEPESPEAREVPITATTQRSMNLYADNIVTITATTDEVTITSASFNRGNCPVGFTEKPYWGSGEPPEVPEFEFPFTLKFGQSRSIPYHSCGGVLEATVGTNYGDYALSFEQ